MAITSQTRSSRAAMSAERTSQVKVAMPQRRGG